MTTKRTTINLPEELWTAAKIQSFKLGMDFQDLVADRLTGGLSTDAALDMGAIAKQIEKIAEPALVSRAAMLKAFETHRSAWEGMQGAFARLLDSKEGRMYDSIGRSLEKASEAIHRELEEGGRRALEMRATIDAALAPPRRAKKKGGRNGKR